MQALMSACRTGVEGDRCGRPALVFAAAWASPTQRAAAWRWAAAALVGVIPMLLARLIVLGTLGGDVPHPALVVGSWSVRERLALATTVQTLVALFCRARPPLTLRRRSHKQVRKASFSR